MSGAGRRFVIVASRFNEMITNALVEGANRALRMHGVNEVTEIWVPGSWEIPLAAKKAAESRPAAIIAVGCILQGATIHASQLSNQVAAAVCDIALKTGVPITWGVLTCATQQEAMERAGMKLGNKGEEAARAAIELASALERIAQ